MAAAASDKARFFMEQSVPELQDFSRKGIFSSAEITAIAQKRSEFEHLINMAGAAKPVDYARYATYEMNLDKLRQRRSKRLGVKSTMYTGSRRVFFVLDRALRKFPGDMGLWMQYLEFCRHEGANRKLSKGLAQCLRLHPLEWQVWVWAARYYTEQHGDMANGRSYMQRGLRFCKRERRLWVEYAKLEMSYVAKIAARRKILGLDEKRTEQEMDQQDDPDADMIALPAITGGDLRPESNTTAAVDETALSTLSTKPALEGAIPLAILEAGTKQFEGDAQLTEDFFDMFAEFPDLPCTAKLLDACMQHLESIPSKPKSQATIHGCKARRQLVGEELDSADFPLRLAEALKEFKTADASDEARYHMAAKAVKILMPILAERERLDAGVVRVLDISIRKQLAILAEDKAGSTTKVIRKELERNLQDNSKLDAKLLAEYGLTPG